MYTITRVNNLPIIEIENFFSEEETTILLEPRKRNFETAIGHYPSYYRNNDRLVEDNAQLSSELFNRLKSLKILEKETKTTTININERIRFCKYQKNQQFSKHQDGVYYPNPIHESKFTFLLYLNGKEDFEGGDTQFYSSKTDDHPTKTIIPKKGKLVVFDHELWHKGAKVIDGNKYILRSDVIIERNSKITHHDGYIWNLLKLNEQNFLSCGRDTKIKVWDTNLKLQNTIKVHSKSVLKMVRFNKHEFISCSRDFTVKKWNLSGKIISSISFDEMILNLHASEIGEILAVGTSGRLYVLNSDLQIYKTIQIHKSWIWDIASIKNNIILTCSEDGTLNRTNLISGVTECIYTHNEPLFCLNTRDNDVTLIGSKDGTLIHLSMSTKKYHKTKVHDDIIRSIVWHQENIITCGEDNKVILSNTQSYTLKEILKANNFVQDMILLKGKIYTAGYDGTITIQEI